MTNSRDPNAKAPGHVSGGTPGARPLGQPQTRSMSLKDALAALGEADDKAISQSEAATGVESIMNDKDGQAPAANIPGIEPAVNVEGASPKTKVFGGSDEELKYYQEPVVGWLVVVGGPGIGAHRPIFMGSNTIGSDPGQRIPIDFGDEYISKEEQAYIRYDADDRQFLFIPNLAKTNVVSIDNVKPTSAVRLMPYDIIAMGDTQLVFIPFCGEEFDWADLPVHKK